MPSDAAHTFLAPGGCRLPLQPAPRRGVLGLPPLAGRGGPPRGPAPNRKRTHAAASLAGANATGGLTMLVAISTAMRRILVALMPFLVGALAALVMRGLSA